MKKIKIYENQNLTALTFCLPTVRTSSVRERSYEMFFHFFFFCNKCSAALPPNYVMKLPTSQSRVRGISSKCLLISVQATSNCDIEWCNRRAQLRNTTSKHSTFFAPPEQGLWDLNFYFFYEMLTYWMGSSQKTSSLFFFFRFPVLCITR